MTSRVASLRLEIKILPDKKGSYSCIGRLKIYSKPLPISHVEEVTNSHPASPNVAKYSWIRNTFSAFALSRYTDPEYLKRLESWGENGQL